MLDGCINSLQKTLFKYYRIYSWIIFTFSRILSLKVKRTYYARELNISHFSGSVRRHIWDNMILSYISSPP